jgi:hypothetical protein
MEKPIIVGVAPSSEPHRHWIYYDDGMVVEFDPTTGRVHACPASPTTPGKHWRTAPERFERRYSRRSPPMLSAVSRPGAGSLSHSCSLGCLHTHRRRVSSATQRCSRCSGQGETDHGLLRGDGRRQWLMSPPATPPRGDIGRSSHATNVSANRRSATIDCRFGPDPPRPMDRTLRSPNGAR